MSHTNIYEKSLIVYITSNKEGKSMQFFISHSSKDADIAREVKKLIDSLSSKSGAFCTSTLGVIGNGEDFVKTIEKKLDECDYIIVLLSKNYVESKYCMLELGFSYARWVHTKKAIINILTLPGGEGLLNETPLNHLQYHSLLNEDTWVLFLNNLRKMNEDILISNNDIHSYVEKFKEIYTKNADFFEQADLIGCCSDSSNENAIKCSKHNDTIAVRFNLFSNRERRRPEFISSVLHFYNDLDLYSYYAAKNDIKLHCAIENYTESIKQIQVEFQTENNRAICTPFVFELKDRITDIDIPISDMSKYVKDLKRVVNICFVVKENFFIEDEGSYDIKDLRIK